MSEEEFREEIINSLKEIKEIRLTLDSLLEFFVWLPLGVVVAACVVYKVLSLFPN